MGSEGRANETPNPIMLIMTITVKPRYCPIVILSGVVVRLTAASAKKVTRTNMSSILVMAKELHAVPIDLPNSMVVSQAVVARVW